VQDLIERILGFMPQRSVFWSALGTSLIIIIAQTVYRWLHKLTILPWMREENQKNRQKILQEVNKKRPDRA
jgi:heme exporter protein D